MPDTTPFNVLVFSKTSGYRHDSIPAGIRCVQSLADRTKLFTVTAGEDASLFTTASLCNYSVIVLLQCIGEVFNQEQLDALKQFVRAGGGVVAIHGAAAGMPNDEWYGKLVG
jgi:type 1 glutamine amidotransferase